jgi:predicted signal transduction protein with EAL and GGDEF domain
MELEEIRRYLSDNTFDLTDSNKTENVYITLSFGVASYPRDAKNVVELFRVADSALFRAKELGKNKICLSEAENMVLKSSYFTKTQLDRLSKLSKSKDKTEAFLLREALDDLFKKYSK